MGSNSKDGNSFRLKISIKLSLYCPLPVSMYDRRTMDQSIIRFGNHWDFEENLKPQNKFDAYLKDKSVMQVEELTKSWFNDFRLKGVELVPIKG